eukprot:SAG31_NODE_2049_length_6564_cov_13.995824_7_plen_123_part_00
MVALCPSQHAHWKLSYGCRQVIRQHEKGVDMVFAYIGGVEALLLCAAHAKCRMGKIVTEEDVNVATELMKFALYSEKKQDTAMMPAEDDPFDGEVKLLTKNWLRVTDETIAACLYVCQCMIL